jgi:hypothetical protein
MLAPQEQETPGTALGSTRPSRDMSPYEEPGYRSSSFAVHGISSLFTVAPLVDGAGGYPLELIFLRNLPNLSVREFTCISFRWVGLPGNELFRCAAPPKPLKLASF